MTDEAEIGIETIRPRKRSSKLWILTLFIGIGIGYAICSIQSWLFR
jgi:hypothetical protein